MRRHATEASTPPKTLRVRDLLLSAMLSVVALPAAALGLGELRVQSFIGEPLEATVNLLVAEEEEIAAECFASAPVPGSGVPVLNGARMTLERSGTRATLRITTAAPMSEPTVRLRLLTTCSSAGGLSRDYLLAFDPRPVDRRPVASVTAPAPVAARAPTGPAPGRPEATPAAQEPKAPPALIPGFRPRPGDTLQSISLAIFPREEQARAAYLRALRARNPSVSNLGDGEPLPTDVLLILPDLRALSRTMPPASPRTRGDETRAAKAKPAEKAPTVAAAAPPAKREPEKALEANAPAKAAAPGAAPAGARPAAPAAPTATPAAERGDGSFRLRLSASELDVSRSRGVDERKRAEIRERRLLLEQDDQTAAMLGLRENLRQLENRFAALQRQVTTPGKGVTAEPAKAQPPPTPLAPPVEPVVPRPAPDSAPAATTASTADAAAEEKPVAAEPPVPAPVSKARAPAKTAAAEPAVDWPWLLVGIALALAAGGMTLWKRRSERSAPVAGEAATPWTPAAKTKPPAAARQAVPPPRQEPAPSRRPAPVDEYAEPRAEPRRPAAPEKPRSSTAASSIARAPTAPEESVDAQQMRTRYRQVRFPEIVSGAVVLSDATSVVRGARTLYEDGALSRALELLELAIADNPQARQPWLALLEIHRQEGLAADFGALAARFQWQHGDAPEWPKVQAIGRDFDPDNPLFASDTPVPFDPLTDNWLEVPSDFSPGGLAADLHAAAIAGALGRRAA